MSAMASHSTGVSIVYSTVCSGADQRKHQSSASLAFVRGLHRWPVNSPHNGPVTRKMLPFDDVIMMSTSIPRQSYIHTDHSQPRHMSLCHWVYSVNGASAFSKIKDRLSGIEIPIITMRQSWYRLIFIMGIPILVRCHLVIKKALEFTKDTRNLTLPGEYHERLSDNKKMIHFATKCDHSLSKTYCQTLRKNRSPFTHTAILTTSGAATEIYFVKITFPLQYWYVNLWVSQRCNIKTTCSSKRITQ